MWSMYRVIQQSDKLFNFIRVWVQYEDWWLFSFVEIR